eukprot:906285_1
MYYRLNGMYDDHNYAIIIHFTPPTSPIATEHYQIQVTYMSQVLLFWKPSSIRDNKCKLHRDDEGPIDASFALYKNMNVPSTSAALIINSLHGKPLHKITFIDINAIVLGIHEFNKGIFSQTQITGSTCLSIINDSHIIHLEFNKESQRNCWFRYIHHNIVQRGKHWSSHHGERTDSTRSVAVQYSVKARDTEEKTDDIDHANKDINDIILTDQRLQSIGMLLSGAYLRTPKMISIKDIFTGVFGTTSKQQSRQQDELFVMLTKKNLNASKYTHLLWTKRRNLISIESINIVHIASISVHSLPNEHSQDAFDANIFFIKIKWKPLVELEPLILHHYDLNFLWHFAKALMSCCDAKGITISQSRNARGTLRNQLNAINIFCGTYNVGTALPEQSLEIWLKPSKSDHIKPDVYAIALQEIVDLGTNLLSVSDYRHECVWEKAIYKVLSMEYVKIESIVRGGLVLFLFAKKDIVPDIQNIAFGGLNVGPLGAPNKAGVAIRMQIRDQSVCFIGAHLPSGIDYSALRNESFFRIYRHLRFEGTQQMQNIEIQDHDVIFLFGDLNYRLHIDKSRIDTVSNLIHKRKIQKLLRFDQLNISKRQNKVCPGFIESDITFLPTYKYQPGTNQFERRRSKPLRMPAYTDRILYEIRSPNLKVHHMEYDSVHALLLSDHKPVYGLFEMTFVNEMQPLDDGEDEDDTYSLQIKQFVEKVDFLQKNYKHHLVDGINQLRTNKGNEDKAQANNIIDSIEKSQSELVDNMNSLLKCLRAHHTE